MTDQREHSGLLRVNSAEQAAYLRNVQKVQVLRAFMTPEGMTVGRLAKRLDWPPVRAFREVKKLEQLGLVQLLREEPRAGKPVKVYSCPYRQFFLPTELLSVEDYLTESFQPYESQIKTELALAVQEGEGGVAGFLVGLSGEGVALFPATRRAQPWFPDAPQAPAAHFSIGPLYLDYAQARALQAELASLLERYGQLGGSGRYLHHVILTPDMSGNTRPERLG